MPAMAAAKVAAWREERWPRTRTRFLVRFIWLSKGTSTIWLMVLAAALAMAVPEQIIIAFTQEIQNTDNTNYRKY